DCKLIAFVTGGKLYVSKGGHVHAINAPGTASGPSFAHGLRNDLVFAARGGVYFAKGAKRHARLVAPGGRSPVYNDLKPRLLADAARRQRRRSSDLHEVSRRYLRLGGRDSNPRCRDQNPVSYQLDDPPARSPGYALALSIPHDMESICVAAVATLRAWPSSPP